MFLDAEEIRHKLDTKTALLAGLDETEKPTEPISWVQRAILLDDIRALQIILACVERVDLEQPIEEQQMPIHE